MSTKTGPVMVKTIVLNKHFQTISDTLHFHQSREGNCKRYRIHSRKFKQI